LTELVADHVNSAGCVTCRRLCNLPDRWHTRRSCLLRTSTNQRTWT